MNKELIVKVLNFIKEEPDLKELTLSQIEERFYTFESYLISLVEELLQDKEGKYGTLTTWWLYDSVPKVFYCKEGEEDKEINVESAEDFVNYMVENNGKD